jgi:shikimate dehydrogenase
MIDTRTRLLGVIGNPVAHSLGPAMHNAALEAMGYPAVYLAFRVDDPGGAATAVRALDLGGLSVTIPHKVSIMDYLDEIDPLAGQIGAVNTIVHRDGRLTGYNTDCHGAMAALKEKIELKGKRVAVIGAGGAARAVGFGLKAEGAAVVIYNRNPERGRTLARALGADFRRWEDLAAMGTRADVEVVVHTTSVGMAPDTAACPLPEQALGRRPLVMDIIYTPQETRLLRLARAKGCETIDGLTMFILQGARQLELWTGRPAPVDTMRQAVEAALGEKMAEESGS